MVREYKKKQGSAGKRNYDERYLHEAIQKVRMKKMSIRKASECYAVPHSTLRRWVQKGEKMMSYGLQPALNYDEELNLKQGLLTCAECGFPLQNIDIKSIVKNYLDSKGLVKSRFKNNSPGPDWIPSFMKRHPDSTVKLCENIRRNRAGVTEEVLQAYFNNLEKSLDGVPSSNIINYDETNFTDDPSSVQVIVRRGVKHAERIMDTSKTSTSVMIAGSADGTILPPYIVYKATHLYDAWTEGGIPKAAYNRSPSGWFDARIFEDWFKTIILPYFRGLEGVKVLIGDNLSSHLTLSVIEECSKNNICFVLLPPNSTHLCQPSDVAYFRPLKRAWRAILEEWKLKNRGVMPKTVFPKMLKATFERIDPTSARNLKSGCEACGIMPSNPDRVLRKIPGTNESASQMDTRWLNVFVNHLKQTRANVVESQGSQPVRKKRLNIQPGQSVQPEMFETVEENENADVTPLENYSPHDAEMALDESSKGELIEAAMQTFSEGDHVVFTFKTNRRDILLIGKIIERNTDGSFEITVLREKGTKEKAYFVHPDNEDQQTVELKYIMQKVQIEDMERGPVLISGIDIASIQ